MWSQSGHTFQTRGTMEIYLKDLREMSPAERKRTLREMGRAMTEHRPSLLRQLREALKRLRFAGRASR